MPSTFPICVSLDLETTGLSPDSDDVIEVGAVKFQGDTLLDSFTSLIDPHRPIPGEVERLTGLATRDLAGAPSFASVTETLRAFIGPYPVVGQSIDFDLQFLGRKGLRFSGPAYDTFDLAGIVLLNLPDYSLSSICTALGVEHDRPHRAMNDALMAMAVFVRCLRRLEAMSPATVAEMARIAWRSPDWPLRQIFAGLESSLDGVAEASEPDLEGVDVGSLARRLHVEAPTKTTRDEDGAIDMADLERLLGESGPLAGRLGEYEVRSEQREMAEQVARTFNQGGQLVAEAGTGTGKSLAYLLPAALFAHHRGERIVISTNTISLQEQIVQKDIPDALAALASGSSAQDAQLSFVMLKGRSNYLCLRKWSGLKNANALTPPEARTLIKLLCWLAVTTTGDRGELNLTPPEASVWERLSAQGYDTQAGACPMTDRGLCFYAAARQRAEAAHLLCVNHALLVLDVKHGGLVPAYRHLIVDEAHDLEEVATNQWGSQVDEDTLDEHLGGIAGGGKRTGVAILPRFRLAVMGSLGESRLHELFTRLDQLEMDVQATRTRLSTLFRLLGDFVTSYQRGSREAYARLQLAPSLSANPGWSRIVAAWEEASVALAKLHRGLLQLANHVPGLAKRTGISDEDFRQEIIAKVKLGEELSTSLGSALAQADEGVVHWLTVGGQSATVQIHSAPLHVGPVLQERLFSKVDTLVLTGATLSTEGNFVYLKERLSLKPTSEVLLGSPFDYRKAALVYIPQDMPDPSARDYQAALDKVLRDIALAAHGRTLVLFTSRAALRASRNSLREPMAMEGITVLGQGIDGSPRQLIRTFKATSNVVLLGSGSFWEGVDVAGEALSVLVMPRLPFGVPSDPVFAARSRKFEDPFSHYAVPQAVVRFRQGFGRLIRRSTDRGVFVVLDRRIFSKAYGLAFLDSLPDCTRQVGLARDLPAAINRWLDQVPLGDSHSGATTS